MIVLFQGILHLKMHAMSEFCMVDISEWCAMFFPVAQFSSLSKSTILEEEKTASFDKQQREFLKSLPAVTVMEMLLPYVRKQVEAHQRVPQESCWY